MFKYRIIYSRPTAKVSKRKSKSYASRFVTFTEAESKESAAASVRTTIPAPINIHLIEEWR